MCVSPYINKRKKTLTLYELSVNSFIRICDWSGLNVKSSLTLHNFLTVNWTYILNNKLNSSLSNFLFDLNKKCLVCDHGFTAFGTVVILSRHTIYSDDFELSLEILNRRSNSLPARHTIAGFSHYSEHVVSYRSNFHISFCLSKSFSIFTRCNSSTHFDHPMLSHTVAFPNFYFG